MQLSDKGIRRALHLGDLSIEPRPARTAFQPATVDLRLGALEGVYRPEYTDGLGAFMLPPGVFMLGATLESISVGRRHSGEVKGKSTNARLGLMVECAGFIDPDFHGQVTLEIKNLHHDREIPLTIGMLICQIKFNELDEPCERGYGHKDLGNHYQGQTGPTGARAW